MVAGPDFLNWPDHWFEPGWSITRVIPPGHPREPWRAVAEWGPGLLMPTTPDERPDFLVTGHGATEAEARSKALQNAASKAGWERIAEPDETP